VHLIKYGGRHMECAYIYEPLPSAIGGQSSMAVNQANLNSSTRFQVR